MRLRVQLNQGENARGTKRTWHSPIGFPFSGGGPFFGASLVVAGGRVRTRFGMFKRGMSVRSLSSGQLQLTYPCHRPSGLTDAASASQTSQPTKKGTHRPVRFNSCKEFDKK